MPEIKLWIDMCCQAICPYHLACACKSVLEASFKTVPHHITYSSISSKAIAILKRSCSRAYARALQRIYECLTACFSKSRIVSTGDKMLKLRSGKSKSKVKRLIAGGGNYPIHCLAESVLIWQGGWSYCKPRLGLAPDGLVAVLLRVNHCSRSALTTQEPVLVVPGPKVSTAVDAWALPQG